ncbi:DNA-binding response regulator [uncultured Jatrophihabitans sp.]|uniref:DNA-binding response regulator n=1 Tax=uncultured Jatrophihabitans sp. TaxID=1610747 RepID=UPI0035CC7463
MDTPSPVRAHAEGHGHLGARAWPDRCAVEKHIANVFLKLDLPPSGTDYRRMLAVLRYLQS